MNKIMAHKTADKQKCSKGISKATVYFHRKVKTFVLLEDCVDIFAWSTSRQEMRAFWGWSQV